MLLLTTSVFKHLVRRGAFKLMSKNIVGKNCVSDKILDSCFESNDFNLPSNLRRMPMDGTIRYIYQLENPHDRDWKDLVAKLNSMNVMNVSTTIFQACLRLNKIDIGMSYYNYMIKEGEQLSDLDLMFFSKLLIKRKNEIPKYEELIIHLYNNIKDHLLNSSLIKSFILDIFLEVPACFFDIVKCKREKRERRNGNLSLITKALQMDMIDVALDFMTDFDFVASEDFLNNYINYCIRMTEAGKFSLDHINNLIKICEKKATVFNHTNLGDLLQSLVNALMKHQGEYQWSVSECELSEKNVCLNCGSTLTPVSISEAEFEELKDYFFKNAFIRNNVFLSSSDKEVEMFLKFLKECHPYDIVIDGLNLLYRKKVSGAYTSTRYIEHFLEKKLRVLTIGRCHTKTTLTKSSTLKRAKNKRNAQFFFTSNVSDDDLFFLYATLLRGLNTFFVTGDFLSTYSAQLDEEMKCLFLKWQLSHQYFVKTDGKLCPPLPHCGLSQLTKTPTKQCNKYIWHLSQQVNNRVKINVGTPLKWHCLQAVKNN